MSAPPAADRRLRVLVVDDHDVVHWGFRLMLGEQPWVERFLSARTGQEAEDMARRYAPHVALVDLFLGGESGGVVEFGPHGDEHWRVRLTVPMPQDAQVG